MMRTVAPWHISLEQDPHVHHALTHLCPPALSRVLFALPFSLPHLGTQAPPAHEEPTQPLPAPAALTKLLCAQLKAQDSWFSFLHTPKQHCSCLLLSVPALLSCMWAGICPLVPKAKVSVKAEPLCQVTAKAHSAEVFVEPFLVTQPQSVFSQNPF